MNIKSTMGARALDARGAPRPEGRGFLRLPDTKMVVILVLIVLLLAGFTLFQKTKEISSQQPSQASQLSQEELADLTSDHLDEAFTDLEQLDTLS